MNPALKTTLLFAGLLGVVVAGAYLYSRTLEPAETPALPSPVAEVDPAIAEGLAALRDGRLDDARRSFESVPPGDPSHLAAQRNLGLVDLEGGDDEGALATFERLLRVAPDDPELHVARSWALYRLGRVGEAETATLRALEVRPGHLSARYNVAFLRVAQGRLAEAIPAYQRAIGNDLSGTYMTRALQDLAALAAERPDFADVHYALAFFANANGRVETEIEELERYLELDPEGSGAVTARQRLAEARAAFR